MNLRHFIKMFSKNKKLVKLLKIGMAFYLLTFLFSYLTTDTSAYFTSSTQTSGTIQVGTWETEPENAETSIVFDDIKEKTAASCPVAIETFVTNKSEIKMADSKRYIVYFSGNDVSEEQMEEISLPEGEGSFGPLDAGETKTVTIKVNEPGFYKIAILSESNQKIAVSKSIKVKCGKTEEKSKEKQDDSNEEEVEEQLDVQTEEESEDEVDKDNPEEPNEDISEEIDEEGE